MQEFEHTRRRTLIAAVIAVAGVLLMLQGAEWSGKSGRWTESRMVVVEGREVGEVLLRPLIRVEGRWGLDICFTPVDDNLDHVHQLRLEWWQIVNRSAEPGYPRMDLQRGRSLPGSPGDDDNPSYYTRRERLGLGGEFTQQEIFADNRFWMKDVPEPRGGVSFECWLVRREDHRVIRLVGFEWGMEAGSDAKDCLHQPKFISETKYNFPDILRNSGFGSNWIDATADN